MVLDIGVLQYFLHFYRLGKFNQAVSECRNLQEEGRLLFSLVGNYLYKSDSESFGTINLEFLLSVVCNIMR